MKFTVKGEHPLAGSAVKLAIGPLEISTIAVELSLEIPSYTFSLTMY